VTEPLTMQVLRVEANGVWYEFFGPTIWPEGGEQPDIKTIVVGPEVSQRFVQELLAIDEDDYMAYGGRN